MYDHVNTVINSLERLYNDATMEMQLDNTSLRALEIALFQANTVMTQFCQQKDFGDFHERANKGTQLGGGGGAGVGFNYEQREKTLRDSMVEHAWSNSAIDLLKTKMSQDIDDYLKAQKEALSSFSAADVNNIEISIINVSLEKLEENIEKLINMEIRSESAKLPTAEPTKPSHLPGFMLHKKLGQTTSKMDDIAKEKPAEISSQKIEDLKNILQEVTEIKQHFNDPNEREKLLEQRKNAGIKAR